MNGLWLLFQRDPAGFRYLDISERGMLRSFWALAWAAPSIALSWIWWRITYVQGGGPLPAGLFFFRLGLVEVANWVAPLVLAGLLCLALDFGGKFSAVVVVTNWVAVPASYAYGLLIAFMILTPGLAGFIALIWLMLMIMLVVVLFRILWTVCGDHLLMVTTLTMVLLVPGMLLSEVLERYLSVFPR